MYLNAASLGDQGVVRQSLEERDMSLNVNCVDYMGRNALHLAIDSEKLDVIEVLLDNLSFNCIEEAVLHAISKGATKVVKIISEHPNFMAGEDKIKRVAGGEAFFRTEEKSQFPPDITPLILAAHYNNHEIIQMCLSRSHRIEKPHLISCKCADCVTKQNYDSLKRSRSRLNAYKALASPAYMALSSPDPIMATFELRQEMMKLAEVEKEFKVRLFYYRAVHICSHIFFLMFFFSLFRIPWLISDPYILIIRSDDVSSLDKTFSVWSRSTIGFLESHSGRWFIQGISVCVSVRDLTLTYCSVM